MAEHLTAYQFPEWGPQFPVREHRDRLMKVRAEMARRGLDTLLVTSPPNLTYLIGFDAIWYSLGTPTSVALRADSDDVLFFDSAGHANLVPVVVRTEVISSITWFGLESHAPDEATGAAEVYTTPWVLGNPVCTLVEILRGRGWLRGRVGVERWSRAPVTALMTEIEAGLAAAGTDVVDGSWCVDRVRMVKSPLEIECVRAAARIATEAMTQVGKFLAPGVSELEIQGYAQYVMSRLGGEDPAIRTAIRTGPRGASHHAAPTRRRIRSGDLVWVDFSGSYNRYHVDIARNFSLGEPDRRWRELFEKTSGSVAAVQAAVRPGDPMHKVQQVADRYIDEAGLREHAWFIGGYALGIAIPPDWVGHVFFGDDGFEVTNFEPGMVMNYENVYDIVDEDWPGGRGASVIDTFLMTDAGIEVLTPLDRTIVVV